MKTRRFADGSVRSVHTIHGLRKICRCSRRRWSDCSHAWHFSFRWKGQPYRFSMDRYAGAHVGSRSDANGLADQIRTAIPDGTFDPRTRDVPPVPQMSMTFRQLTELWTSRYGYQLSSARNDAYRLKQITKFMLTAYSPPVTMAFSCGIFAMKQAPASTRQGYQSTSSVACWVTRT